MRSLAEPRAAIRSLTIWTEPRSSRSAPSGGFALEVVFPGDSFQHGFYRDDNRYEQQISIIDHVVGHNNFAYTSMFPHYRAGQGLVASRELDALLQSSIPTLRLTRMRFSDFIFGLNRYAVD